MARTQSKIVDGVGDSPWAFLNAGSTDNQTSFFAFEHNGATGNYSLEVSLSDTDPSNIVRATFARVTTTITVTDTDHGLSAGDDVVLVGSDWDTTGATTIPVATVADADTFTITVADSGRTSGGIHYMPIKVRTLTGFSAVSGENTGTLSGPVKLMRIVGDSGSTNKRELQVTQSDY